MRPLTLALWILVMTFRTYGVIKTANYKSVFVQESDVVVQSNVPAKSFVHCTNLYQPKESAASFFRYQKETQTCFIGEVAQTGTVNKVIRDPGMQEYKARHELIRGEFKGAQ